MRVMYGRETQGQCSQPCLQSFPVPLEHSHPVSSRGRTSGLASTVYPGFNCTLTPMLYPMPNPSPNMECGRGNNSLSDLGLSSVVSCQPQSPCCVPFFLLFTNQRSKLSCTSCHTGFRDPARSPTRSPTATYGTRSAKSYYCDTNRQIAVARRKGQLPAWRQRPRGHVDRYPQRHWAYRPCSTRGARKHQKNPKSPAASELSARVRESSLGLGARVRPNRLTERRGAPVLLPPPPWELGCRFRVWRCCIYNWFCIWGGIRWLQRRT